LNVATLPVAVAAEHAKLLEARETLQREHEELQRRPFDAAEHHAHAEKLHRHLDALRAHLSTIRGPREDPSAAAERPLRSRRKDRPRT